jgi:hypothetical protein
MFIGLKKIPVVPVPDRPYFFLPTLLFFQHDWPYNPIFSGWLRVAAKMASVVTLIIEKNMKKIFKKKIYFRPTDPNFFAIWNRNHRYFFLRLTHKEWRFNLSFPWVSMLFLNSWRVSSHIVRYDTYPPAIQKQHWHSREAQIEPEPLFECEWAIRIRA